MNTPANPNPASSTLGLRITPSPSEPPTLPPDTLCPSIPSRALGIGIAAGGDNIGLYNFPWFITKLEHYGKQQFGDHFTIRQQDHDIIRRLLAYFVADASLADQFGMDLNKGILLTGPVGCGKTSLMSLIKLAARPERNFLLKPSRDVSFEFLQEGYEVILRYSKMSYTARGPLAYCFDDLGAEQTLKYYGNECNVMAEIILSRYDGYIATDMITHVTTNLSATEIENSYGPRVRSRMREMFNLVGFPDATMDKRI